MSRKLDSNTRRLGLATATMAAAKGFSNGRRLAEQISVFCQRKPLGAVALVVLLAFGVTAIFANQIAPYDPLKNNYTRMREGPSSEFWFGTDYLGRDVFSRVIHGTRISLLVGFSSVALGTSLGSIWGLVSGFRGGKIDMFSQRILEIVMSFPSLILAILLLAGMGAGLLTVIVAIGVTRVPLAVRVIRSVTLVSREYTYVEAARSVGASDLRIMRRHVLPNCMAPYLVVATAHLGTAIIMEASLGFLGVGIPPPAASWGNMLGGAVANILVPLWWLVVFPGIAIVMTVLAFNLLGDALRDVLDPRLRGT